MSTCLACHVRWGAAGRPGTSRGRRGWLVRCPPGAETAGVPFGADNLVAWLVGVLADAGRRKLTKLVLGTEQERALRSAATAAVERTAGELHPDDAEQAAHLARLVDQVFKAPVPGVPLAGHVTVLEELSARTAGQLEIGRAHV